MLNIAYTHASVVLVIFHYYMLQNIQSNRYSLYSMTSVFVSFTYPIKLNISTRKGVTEILPKKLYCHGQKYETITLLLIYSKALFELIIDQYGAVILL